MGETILGGLPFREMTLDEWVDRLPLNHSARDELSRLRASLAAVTKEMERYARSVPDDLRWAGWTVAVHNDYRQNGVPHTFWLFTRGDRAIKGEGETDAIALEACRAAIRAGKEAESV